MVLYKRALKIHGVFLPWKHFLLFHFQPALILRQRLSVIPDEWGDDVSGENWTSSLDCLTPAWGPSPSTAEPQAGDAAEGTVISSWG